MSKTMVQYMAKMTFTRAACGRQRHIAQQPIFPMADRFRDGSRDCFSKVGLVTVGRKVGTH